MTEKTYATPLGEIHYWVSRAQGDRPWLVFLPGLTADHHLFDRQTAAFAKRYHCLVWDAPAHGLSRPFPLTFSLDDMARWLNAILLAEGAESPVLVGQSMGGYLAQAYIEQFPGAAGFVSVDSAPLSRPYYTNCELALLHHTYWMYRCIPWPLLVRLGVNGTSQTPYGRALMEATMKSFTPKEYCLLADHGYRMLAQGVTARSQYQARCPVLLLCGEKDGAGSSRRYNRAWAMKEGHRLVWLKGAGHNANTDVPEEVNRLIGEFVDGL